MSMHLYEFLCYFGHCILIDVSFRTPSVTMAASERPRGMAAPSVMDAVKRDRKCPTSNIQYIRMLAKGIRQSKQKRTSVVRGGGGRNEARRTGRGA